MLARVWARLREAYEAELVRRADNGIARPVRRGRHLGRPRRDFDLVALHRETLARRVVLRAPRRIPWLAPLLTPALYQVGLPGAVAFNVLSAVGAWRRGNLAGWLPSPLFFVGSVAVITVLAQLLLGVRWARLRERAYDRWAWRHEAALESLGPDEIDAAEFEALQLLMHPRPSR